MYIAGLVLREKNVMIPISSGVSNRANIRHTVEEIIVHSVDLFYTKKGSGSLRKPEKSSFMSVSSGLPFSLPDIV